MRGGTNNRLDINGSRIRSDVKPDEFVVKGKKGWWVPADDENVGMCIKFMGRKRIVTIKDHAKRFKVSKVSVDTTHTYMYMLIWISLAVISGVIFRRFIFLAN